MNSRLASPIARFVTATLVAAGTLVAGTAIAAKIDMSTADGAVAIQRKIQCSMTDGQPIVYYWTGEMFSRVPGERDRKLFRLEGMNIRQCGTVQDAQKGKGFVYVSREIMLYQDPATGGIVKQWKNPWTGEDVNVIHVANDPVNARGPTFAIGPDGAPRRFTGRTLGNRWWTTDTVPLFYENPLQGGYQDYVGGKYHATEMFNSFGDLDDLLSDKTATAQVRIGWVRISGWLPWMKMGDRVGDLYFHAAGQKLASFDEMPASFKDEIRRSYPEYTTPPPLDDKRPNETSWTYFRKQVPAKGAAGH